MASPEGSLPESSRPKNASGGPHGGDRPLGVRVLKAGAWSYGYNITFQILRFVVFTILARLLGPDTYGVVSMAMLTVAFAEVVVGPTVTDPIIQRENLEQGHVDAVFALQLFAGLVYAGICWALAGRIAAAFNEPLVAEMIPWFGLAIVLAGAAAAPGALLHRELRYDLLALRGLTGLVVGASVGLYMAFNGYGAWSLVGQQLAMLSTDVIVLYALSAWRPKGACRKRHFKEVIGAIGRMSGSSAMGLLEVNIPRILLGISGGALAIGYFSVGMRIVETLRVSLIMPLMNVWFPVIAKVQGDAAKLAEATRRGVEITSFLGAPAFAGIAAIAPTLIPFAFGEDWAPGAPALQALCALGVFWALMGVNISILRGLGRQDLVFYRSIARLALTALFLYAFGRFGAVQSALALTLTMALNWAWDARLISKLTPISLLGLTRIWATPLLGSAAMFALVSMLRRALEAAGVSDLIILIACVPVGVAVYGAIVALFARKLLADALARLKGMLGAQAGA
ncbi:MAG: lipopolysaccharide biosynthesis protein [Maricaulaceae bacterium]|jgi:PST family polysaccharide transporter